MIKENPLNIVDQKQSSGNEIKKVFFINQISAVLLAYSYGLSTILDLTINLYAKDILKIQPSTLSNFKAFTIIPFVIKPFFGLLSDSYPILGYRRKSYLYISFLVCSSMLLTISYYDLSAFQASIIIFVLSLGISFSMLIGEAIVIETSQQSDSVVEFSKNLISIYFFFRYLGNLTSALFKGYLIEWFGVKNVFLIANIFSILYLVSGIILIEKKIDYNEEKSNLQKKGNNHKQLFYQFLDFLKQKFVLVPCLFMYLFRCAPEYSETMFYFMSNQLNFLPSELGLISFFSTILILAAIQLYRIFLIKYNFRRMLAIGTILTATSIFFAFCFVMRWNLFFGIPDFLMAVLSNSLHEGFAEIVIMPLLALGCELCPKNLEATVYSFFMSTHNFGVLTGQLLNAFLTYNFSITSNNFDNLPNMILVVNVIIFIPLFLIYFVDEKYFYPEMNDDFSRWEKNILNEKLLSKGDQN